MGKLSQANAGFWYAKLKAQLVLLKEQKKKESLERAYALDIALAYLYLYLFIESTVDYLAQQLFPHAGLFDGYGKYKAARRNVYQKIEYLFATFCNDLPFHRYSDLKEKVEPLAKMRNKVVHLEEMVWFVDMIFDENGKPSGHREIPNKYAEDLTVDALRRYYASAWEFLDVLKQVLNEGFENKEIEVSYDGEKKVRNLVDYVYEISVVPPANRIEL